MGCNPISEARKAKGLTQEELGRILGVRFNTISRWELGKAHPSRRREKELREVLGLNDLQIWQVFHFRPGATVKRTAERRIIW